MEYHVHSKKPENHDGISSALAERLSKPLHGTIIRQVVLPGVFSDKDWPIETYYNEYYGKFSHCIGQWTLVCLSKNADLGHDWLK